MKSYSGWLLSWLVASIFCWCAPVCAQRTWYVGSVTGVVQDFDELQPAVDAAAPGDRIAIGLLSPTATLPVTISKPLTFGGINPSERVRSPITVEGLGEGERVVLSSMRLTGSLLLRNNLGSVIMNRVGYLLFPSPQFPVSDRRVTVESCAYVAMTECGLLHTEIRDSRVTISGGAVFGGPLGSDQLEVTPAVRCISSSVSVFGVALNGGAPPDGVEQSAAPAIEAVDTELHVVGRTSVLNGGVAFWGEPSGIIDYGAGIRAYGGSVTLDPRARIGFLGPPFEGSSPVQLQTAPDVRARCQEEQITLRGEPGDSGFILLSLPAPILDLPIGLFALDVGTTVVGASAVIDATGGFLYGHGLDQTFGLFDAAIIQGVTVGVAGLQLTNSVYYHKTRL